MSYQGMKSIILIGVIVIAGCNFGRGMRAPRPYEQFDRYGRNTTDSEIYEVEQACAAKYPHTSENASRDERYNRIALLDRCFYENGFRLKRKGASNPGLCSDEKFKHLPACIQWESD